MASLRFLTARRGRGRRRSSGLTGAGLLLALLIALLAPLPVPPSAEGWNQITHRQINAEAVTLFLRQSGGKEKFQLGPFTQEGLARPLRGVGVLSSSLRVANFVSGEARYSMRGWIICGGDWADEPHLYSSVRHFYDPLRRTGVAYLTDQSWAHGKYDSPGIDARSWGLDHPDNPFSFANALAAYKAALEVRDDIPLPPALSPPHFKTALHLQPRDHQDQRALHLSRAYRALGEAMHMLGDMTQPAHVRNDSHPADEPVETSVFSEHVRLAAAHPFLDATIRPFLAIGGGSLQPPRQLFDRVARFTNRRFSTMDTIYDASEDIHPNNGQPPYPEPQFPDLKRVTTVVRGFLRPRKVTRYDGVFGSREVPMVQERLSFHWFDPNQSCLTDLEGAREKLGRATAVPYRLGPYHVPHAFGPEQATVLLPLAIHACADLMELFFPTLQLSATFEEEEEPTENPQGIPTTIIEVTPSMEHLQDRDPAWTDAGLTIRYSGPAELVVQEERKPVYTRKLSFEKGLLRAVENPEGELEQAPLRLYVAGNDRPLSEEESFYELRHGQSAFIQVEAGSRRFRSETWRIPDAAEVSLQPPRQLILELQEGVDRVVHDFEAVATPPGDYIYLWNLDDASALVEERPDPGSHSRQSHLYTGLQPGDAFTPTVTLMDRRGRILGEDSISITVIEGAGRHFFENEVFWKTDTPFANDPSVVFPEVPLHLETEITGLEGTIDPGSPEGRRLAELRAGPGAKTEEVIKERMLQEMARRGITLSDAQMNAALQQALALAGTGTAEQMDRRMPLLASGYREPGTPVTVSLTLSLPAIPRIPLSMTDSRGDPVRLDAQVTVRGWFLTLGTASGPRESGNSGRTTVVWTPPKGAADAFAANLVMMYSLEFYTRGTRELWLDGGSPVVYENLSVSLPVGTVFCPPGDPSDRGGVP